MLRIRFLLFSFYDYIDLLRHQRTCKRCSQNHTCMLYHRAAEKGEASTSGAADVFNEMTSHLTSLDLEYFAKWYELCLLEVHHETSKSKDKFIWGNTSSERERRGVCFSGMILVETDVIADGKYHLKFRRKKSHFNQNTSLKLIPLACEERVIISQEDCKVFNQTTGMVFTVDIYHLNTCYDYSFKKKFYTENITSYVISITRQFLLLILCNLLHAIASF